MDADDSNPVNLTNSVTSIGDDPAWSPDGSQLALASTRRGNVEVCTISTDRDGVKGRSTLSEAISGEHARAGTEVVPMTRFLRTFWMLLGAFLLGAMGACGDGGGDEAADGTGGTTAATAVTAVVTREDVFACLDDAGLAPEDTGLFIIGSESTNVEAIGVRLDAAGIVQFWVFDDVEAADAQIDAWTGSVGVPGAQSPAASEAHGNVAVGYESEPTAADRNAVAACLPA